MPTKKYAVITTSHRGVFFGAIPSGTDTTKDVIALTDVQMCVYWDSSVRGVLGLASTGPGRGCRVTKPVPKITLQSVTSVMEATTEAVAAWHAQPWS